MSADQQFIARILSGRGAVSTHPQREDLVSRSQAPTLLGDAASSPDSSSFLLGHDHSHTNKSNTTQADIAESTGMHVPTHAASRGPRPRSRPRDGTTTTYRHIRVDGDEGDHNYLKCADIIAGIVRARQTYKSIDKGTKESPMQEEFIQRLSNFAPSLNAETPQTISAETAEDAAAYGRTSGPIPLHSASPTADSPPLHLSDDQQGAVTIPRTAAGMDSHAERATADRDCENDDDDVTTQPSSQNTTAAPSSPASRARLSIAQLESNSPSAIPALTTAAGTATATRTPAATTSTAASLPAPQSDYLQYKDGVYHFTGMATTMVPWATYVKDFQAVFAAIENGPCLSTARGRLTTLSEKFQLYALLNSELEANYDTFIRGGGVYGNCTRVDNNLEMKTCIPAPVFLDMISRMAIDAPQLPLSVDATTGQVRTLIDYLEDARVVNPQEVTVEGLGLHPTLYRNKYVPYDMFDPEQNPAGPASARLLEAVLSTDGPSLGDLMGNLVRHQLERREHRQTIVTASEMVLPIYGHHPEEVPRLAAWVHRQGFNYYSRNMWILSLSRQKPDPNRPNALPTRCHTVGDQLRFIFYPLFMASLFPRDPQWAEVGLCLRRTSAIHIDTLAHVRMETVNANAPPPDQVPYERGCSDYYFFYYVWCNIVTLNALRAKLGLNTLNFNPSVHEPAPAFDQLSAGFLLGDVVHDVSSLQKSWIMQYLYVYCQIGVVMSPLRDNVVSMPFFEHPIVKYFRQGMRVSLATTSPLYYHHRLDEPLLEEYATLLQLRSLTPMDLCELARNSVLNSNFPLAMKRLWLGDAFSPETQTDDDVQRSCLCPYRLQYRHQSLAQEETLLNAMLRRATKSGQPTPQWLHAIPFAQPLLLPDIVQQYRSSRHVDCLDRRVVYSRIAIGDTAPTSGAHAPSVASVTTSAAHIKAGATASTSGAAMPASLPLHPSPAITEAVEALRDVIALRDRYTNYHMVDARVEDVFSQAHHLDEDALEYNPYYGVYLISLTGRTPTWPTWIPPVAEFIRDVETVRKVVNSSALRRLAVHRLNLLEQKFLLHISMNISNEAGKLTEKELNNRDFYTAHKVDNNIQNDAGHNARTLLEFFVDKALNHDSDVVAEDGDSPVTLRQLLRRYDIAVQRITVDELHHQLNTHSDLHDLFLSPYNFMQGRYFAELTKKTIEIYKEDAFSFAESRLVLHGGSAQEWYDLARWFDGYGMASHQNRWVISFPRQYRQVRREGKVRNFGEYLDNLFRPLWEISLHPARDTKFHYFLAHVAGFDCIGDESKIDMPLSGTYPHDWTSDLNPPYNYYLYYLWANVASLNNFRASRGLSTFSFRPQCGEVGGADHLIGGFLLAHSINHGVTLSQHPVLEYIFYITQIGVAMSPLSNTAAASAYLENPFPVFFHRGLNVSLATNQPLYFHFTREPLIEEYSIAAKLWLLEMNDLSEVARNSVLQSGFPPSWKATALGPLYRLRSTLGNDARLSRVSDIRVAYRYETYHAELDFLDDQLRLSQPMPRALWTLDKEMRLYQSAIQRLRVRASMATQTPDTVGAAHTSASPAPPPAAAATLSSTTHGPPAPPAASGLKEAIIADRTPDRPKDSVVDVLPPSLLYAEPAVAARALRQVESSGTHLPVSSIVVASARANNASVSPSFTLSDSIATVAAAPTSTLDFGLGQNLQSEVARLEKELKKMTVLAEAMTAENTSIAEEVNRVRAGLQKERLTVAGGLGVQHLQSLSGGGVVSRALEKKKIEATLDEQKP